MKTALYAAALPLLALACGSPAEQPAEGQPASEMEMEVTSKEPIQAESIDSWAKSAGIYEVNLRQYSEEGSFAAFEEHLPRLKELGVDILWFMPIFPIGEENRKGTLGSYYAVKDYMAVNPEHGTMEDFKAMVDKCHEMGFKVILDWVANHTAWDNHLITEHPEYYTKDAEGNMVPPVDDWTDVADLNYDEPGLRNYMIDALKFWVQEADIDGYRCDVAEMVPMDFWVDARAELDKIKPVFMLAEGQDPALHEAFHMTYSWEFHHLMNDIAKGEKSPEAVAEFYAKDQAELPEGAYRMHFITNHDENSWNGTAKERLGDAEQAFAVLAATMPGMPLIYSGQEAGLDKRLDFFEKDVIEWKEHPNADLYKKLFALKEEGGSLWHGAEGGDCAFWNTNEKNGTQCVAMYRQNGVYRTLIVINLTGEPAKARLTGHEVRGIFTDIFTGEELGITLGSNIKLEPWQFHVATMPKVNLEPETATE